MFNLFRTKKDYKLKPVVLVMYDGWGLAPPSQGNSITMAKTPNMDSFYTKYPHGQLIAAGESVGLPAGEVGNSEVGHLTAGVGRVIYQSLKRINLSIEHGEFFENQAFSDAINHAIQNNSNLHIMGLIGAGNVHSNTEHLYALIQLAKKQKFERVYLHLFTDGRDSPPQDGINVIRQIQEKLDFLKVGKIASITGRYFAMDRDGRWERINRTYNSLVLGMGNLDKSAISAMQTSYNAQKTDEFLEPVLITDGQKVNTISDNDSVIFFNFRVDRARELTMSFVLPDFETIDLKKYGFDKKEGANQTDRSISTFKRDKILKNLFFVSMTEYQVGLPVSSIAFPPQTKFPQSIPEIISNKGMKQFHLAESEKERMVTYYFRGMNSEAFQGEDVLIVPSPKVATYDKKPEMSAYKLVEAFKKAIDKDIYSFVVMNFANPDMVAHSGKLPAAIKAIGHVDKCIGEIAKKTLEADGTLLISADHGNAEELLFFDNQSFFYTTEKGEMNTDHSFNPVPVLIINNRLEGFASKQLNGTLSDIAPTILDIMNVAKPEVMSGNSLLDSELKEVLNTNK